MNFYCCGVNLIIFVSSQNPFRCRLVSVANIEMAIRASYMFYGLRKYGNKLLVGHKEIEEYRRLFSP